MKVTKRKATGTLREILDEFHSLPQKEQIRRRVNTAMQLEKEATINKAVEWLQEQEEMVEISFQEDFIERFRKAMEE